MQILACLSNITYSLDSNSSNFNEFYYSFQIVMFCITLLFVTFIGIFFYAMYFYPPFHSNLQILMANIFISYGMLTIGRLMSLISAYNCPSDEQCFVTEMLFLKDAYYSELIKFISMVAFVTASLWIIGERTWATIYLKGYENKQSTKVIIGIIILQWLMAAIIIFFFFSGFVPLLLLTVILLSCGFGFLMINCYMQNVNRRRYHHSKKFGNAYTLSERYQLEENIQTGPVITTFLIITVILHNLHLFAAAILYFNTEINNKLIGKMIFEFLFTVDPAAFSIPLLFSVKKWRQIFKTYLIRKQMFRNCILNSNIKIKDIEKEGDLYFRQLKQTWT